MKNFTMRSLTGIIYVGTVVFGVVCNSYTFLALFAVITAICLREFYRMMNAYRDIEINSYVHGSGGALMFLTVFLYVSGISGRIIFSLYIIYAVGTFIYELYANRKNPLDRLAYIFLGQIYIALPFSTLNLLAFPDSTADTSHYQWVWIMALFLFIWANDSGAYLVGVTFGKHRLWERISPLKSWEGFFGGLVFTIITAFVYAHFQPQIARNHWIALSVGVVVFSTYGDLVESMIKRTSEVKDSGRALPGHGGFLDRFDSLLLAVYVMVMYVQIFNCM